MAGQHASEKYKTELRADFLRRRDQLAESDVRQASAEVCERLRTFAPFQRAQAVAGYAAVRNEIDPSGYLHWRLGAGARVYYPRVIAPGEMAFVRVAAPDALSPGAFGVPEPAGAPSPVAELELFLVPGVAFDRRGNRLGFGGGYYDRVLEKVEKLRNINGVDDLSATRDIDKFSGATAPVLVGICHHWQLVDGQIPVESHDIAMDVIVTDRALVERAGAGI